jgi:hypothetical protein
MGFDVEPCVPKVRNTAGERLDAMVKDCFALADASGFAKVLQDLLGLGHFFLSFNQDSGTSLSEY